MGVCFSSVEQGSVGIIEQWGRYDRNAGPGFQFLNPCCHEEMVGHISQRIQQLDVSCETKTKDNVFVLIVVSVQYMVVQGKEYDAFYKLTDARSQITAYIFDVVRATVPKMNLDDVFTLKEEIANDVKEQLKKAMDSFGYQIVNTLVTDISPALLVKNAMNEINAASRNRVATHDKAEAEKLLVVKAAEAEAESKYLQGVGIARQRQAIVTGLRDSVTAFSKEIPGTSAAEIMQMMMLTQYFDMLKDVGGNPKNNTVMMPAGTSVTDEIRTGLLQGSAGR